MRKPLARRAFPKGRVALLVACKACDGDAKALRESLRAAARAKFGPRATRVVGSTCLSLCPSDAVAVAWASPAGTRYAAVRDGADPVAVLDLLECRPRGDGDGDGDGGPA